MSKTRRFTVNFFDALRLLPVGWSLTVDRNLDMTQQGVRTVVKMTLPAHMTTGMYRGHYFLWVIQDDGLHMTWDWDQTNEGDQRVARTILEMLGVCKIEVKDTALVPLDKGLVPQTPVVYLMAGPDNSVSISMYSGDHPDYESNHWNVLDHHDPRHMTQEALQSVLRNVLSQCGLKVVME